MKGTCWRVFVLLGVALIFTIGISAQTERIVYAFTNGSDEAFPQGGLVSDGKGNFYGTALGGTTSYSGCV